MPDSNLERYIDFFEKLEPDDLGNLARVMTEDIHFADPFNDVHGIESLRKVFQHMYQNLHNPRFTITHSAMATDSNQVGLICWEMASIWRGNAYNVVGMREVAFAPDGRVSSHIDHWDAGGQFYERLPLIGRILKAIRARISV